MGHFFVFLLKYILMLIFLYLSNILSIFTLHCYYYLLPPPLTRRGSAHRAERLFIFSFQITSTVLKFLACRGVICLQLFMAELPGM